MSYHEPSLRVLALDVISYGCQDLMDYERELLPQIHQLWPGLACLFHHQEKFVVIKAMQTLLALTNLSGDFIRSRVMKEVVPGVVQYMEKQGNISSESRSAYLHTTNYKLQLCVLSTLGPLAKNLALDGNDLNTLVNICLPYLSDLQPLPLQNAAVESFSMFIDLDPDALWYTLCEVYCPVMLTPPGSEFLSISFPYGPNKQNRFSTKITEIFNEHFL
ncbi:unnamed protein product [Lymnaea stagnalis]|uniref:TTI1 C-terminal TPR domain-containing protein n=1 Tax=Lymnaea stagnalis TaxID=6523 RepID=A0AAV2IL26_LYMST